MSDPDKIVEQKDRADEPKDDVEGHLKKENVEVAEEPDVEGHKFASFEQIEEKKE